MSRVRVGLEGGIGNLLFQFSAAITLQDRYGYDISFAEATHGLTTRLETYIGEFDFFDSEDSFGDQKTTRTRANSDFVDRAIQLSQKVRIDRLTTKWAGDFEPCTAPYSKRVRTLKGYFQHPSWYQDSLKYVLDRLDTKRRLNPISVPKNLTAIHLRRSDYVRLGWDLPMSYYNKAIELDEKISKGPVAVFSDDQMVSNLYEDFLSRSGLTIFNYKSFSNASALNDFFTIASAQRIIMSNSTFSWWAASLASYSDPSVKIYCPSAWLPNPGSEVLIDPSWIKVDYQGLTS
jgi:hypothetical protein